jgi:uncharacterized protein (TIGR02001 family)|tara:strand:+ start:726 stop:1319 length:594 start_codon:yes stop_codon:yes gene_type:complete
MKRLLLLVGMLAMPSFAAVSANVSFASDYVWRGMTQSDGPAIQGGFDFEAESGFYAGIWGSNVNFNDGAGSELDYYAGYGFSLGDVGVDIGYIAFDYPKNETGLDFEEIYLGLSFGDLGLLFASGQDGMPDYTEASYAFGDLSISYGTYDDMSDNITISYGFSCGSYDCGITAYDMTDEGYSGVDEDGVYFSISASL